MRKAYLLVDTGIGQAWSIAELLHRTPGITLAIITGPDGVIAMLDGLGTCLSLEFALQRDCSL